MKKKMKLRSVALLLAFTMVLQAALAGCSNTKTPSDSGDGTGKKDPENAVVLKVAEYGALGDGVTDDSDAIDTVFDMAKMKGQNDTPVIIEFEKDKSYYFKDMHGGKIIFDLVRRKNLTLRGDNTTIIMDKSGKLNQYFNSDFSENIVLEGFNFKYSQPWYTLSNVDAFHPGTPDAGANSNNHVNETDPPYIDITTERSLGITETYTPTNRTEFGLPYTEGKSRSHMYIDRIEVLDAAAQKYRVYFQDWDDIRTKMNFLEEYKLQFLLGIPYWDRGELSDGSGSIIVTNTTNFEMRDVNVWAATSFVFHMRNNYGQFNIKNCNVTTEPGSDGVWASQVDIFHLKENRCKFVIEDCLLEKANDDVFNLSTTYLYVNDIMSETEFNMYCQEFGGIYYMPLEAGDIVTLMNEKTGVFVGRTRIKEVVEQSGEINRVIVEDPLPLNGFGVAVYVDTLGQPGSVIRNCTINGTYRFRTPITIENCKFETLYAWIDNIPSVEGPIPRDITFRNCAFTSLKAPDSKVSYMDPVYMMQIGTTCNIGSGVQPHYYGENILFEDCDIDTDLINFMGNTAYVSFVKDGKEYFSIKPEE